MCLLCAFGYGVIGRYFRETHNWKLRAGIRDRRRDLRALMES